MNKACLTGRLTRDPEVRYSQGENPICIARFTLAVNRRFKRDGESEADFISCIAFGKIGENIEKYYKKGMKADLDGHIQTGSYTNKEGNKVYTTEVVVDNIEFGESKSAQNSSQNAATTQNTQSNQSTPPAPEASSDGFMNIPEGLDEELPF